MQILTHSHHMLTKSWEELHQSVWETHPQRILLPHKVFLRYTLFSTKSYFVKEFNNDDVAQIFMDTLEKNINEIYDKFKFPKDDNDHAW